MRYGSKKPTLNMKVGGGGGGGGGGAAAPLALEIPCTEFLIMFLAHKFLTITKSLNSI